MATYRSKRKGSWDIMGFLKKWGLPVLILIGVFPFVWNYIQNFLKGEALQKLDEIADDPQTLKQSMDNLWWEMDMDNYPFLVPMEQLQAYSKIIFDSFSIPRKWWQWLLPSYWVENDKQAYQAILDSFGGNIDNYEHDYVAGCYTLISGSSRRDLDRDIIKYLDIEYLKVLPDYKPKTL